jgi:hypothetical protein
MSHVEGGGGLKSAEKVSHIIWMAPNWLNSSKIKHSFIGQILIDKDYFMIPAAENSLAAIEEVDAVVFNVETNQIAT